MARVTTPLRALRRSQRRVARAGVSISKWRRRIRFVRRVAMVASAIVAVRSFLTDHDGSRDGGGGQTVKPPPRPQPTPSSPAPVRNAPSPTDDAVPVGVASRPTPSPVPATDRSAGEQPVSDAASARYVSSDGADPPDGYPVKVNTRSGIYHVPGGLAYERTRPDRWYRSTADAETDGFRASKA